MPRWTVVGMHFTNVSRKSSTNIENSQLMSKTKDGLQIDVEEKDQERLPNKTLLDGNSRDKYTVGLAVFHQLHCLVSISTPLP